MRRQILTVFSAVTIVSLLFPAIAFAEDYTWSDNGDSTCTITDYIGPGGDVTIPDLLGGLTVTNIGDGAFYFYSGLNSVTIPNSVTTIGNRSFQGCTGLNSVTIPDSVTTIGDFAFLYCPALTSVEIGESVSTIGDGAFALCRNLTAINVDILNSFYSSIEGVLFNKTQNVLVQYPGGEADAYLVPDSITTIGNQAFRGTTVTGIIIPDSVTTIGNGAFMDADYLISVTIPDSVTTIGDGAFMYCNGLTSVMIGNSVTTIGDDMFFGCNSLTSIMIPDSVTTIGSDAFKSCRSLTSVTIGNSVTNIGNSAFYNCSSLNGVIIPDSVITIDHFAFYNCFSLNSVMIGNSVTTIGMHAFYGCSGLTGVYFKGNAPGLGVNVFNGVDTATVYYIPGTVGWGATYGGLPTAPWPVLMADVDIDGKVNFSDFSVFASAWRTMEGEAGYNFLCDFVDDDVIDVSDLVVFCENWLVIDTISNHVFEIEMSLSYDFGVGYGSSVPVDYQFDAWMWVDGTVVSGTVETPGGVVYPAEMHEDGENWLGVYAESASLGDLSDFTDGVYIFTVTYPSGESQSTPIPFELADGSPIPPVDQRLIVTEPLHNATDVALDTNITWTPVGNPDWTYGFEWFPVDDTSHALSGSIEDSPYDTTTAGPLELSPDTLYEIEITVNHAIRSTNADGIPYVVDKDSEVEITFTTVSASYLDNFNDNVMGSMWTMMASNGSNSWLDETSQRLEIRATAASDANDIALYVPNGWHLDTSQDFGFKIRYHNEVDSATWTELLLTLGDPTDIEDNHLQFSVCSLDAWGYTGPHFYYQLVQNGSPGNDEYLPRLSNDGWIYISYDAVLDQIYFGIYGYGPANAVKTVSGLLQGDWAGKQIGPHIGGSSDHVEMLSGQAYWDDLIMDYGGIITE